MIKQISIKTRVGWISAYENKGKNLKTAENLCYKILSIDPNHFGSVFLLANISAINNNFKNAKKLLRLDLNFFRLLLVDLFLHFPNLTL